MGRFYDWCFAKYKEGKALQNDERNKDLREITEQVKLLNKKLQSELKEPPEKYGYQPYIPNPKQFSKKEIDDCLKKPELLMQKPTEMLDMIRVCLRMSESKQSPNKV